MVVTNTSITMDGTMKPMRRWTRPGSSHQAKAPTAIEITAPTAAPATVCRKT